MPDLPSLNPWPELIKGETYRDKYGQVGTCIDLRASDFGHRWAQLAYEGGAKQWHRTHLLSDTPEQTEAQSL